MRSSRTASADCPTRRQGRSNVTKNGHDWSKRFPGTREATLRIRCDRFVIDGEAVLLSVDGGSDFNGLHSQKHDDEVRTAFGSSVEAEQREPITSWQLTRLRKSYSPRCITAH